MKRIIQLTMFLLLALSANAQFDYDTEVYYYEKPNFSYYGTSSNSIYAVLFRGQYMKIMRVSESDLSKQRRNSTYIYTKLIEDGGKYNYCSSVSTQSRVVYRRYVEGKMIFMRWCPSSSFCYGFSKDKSSIVFWTEEDDKVEPYSKRYFKRVKESDVLKGDRDFLYDSSSNSSSYNTQTPSGNGYYQGTTGGGYSNMGTNNNSSRQQSTTTTRRQPTRHNCNTCNGQRRIVKNTYPSMYGMQDSQVRCSECGGYFMRSTGHTHITCPQCHGRGYFTTD